MSPPRPVGLTLSLEEASALLWAVRNLSFDALREGPYHGHYDRACGHGALSSATNRVEAALGAMFRVPEEWCPVCRTYHADPGVKTDAGALVRQCPTLSRDDPRNVFANYPRKEA